MGEGWHEGSEPGDLHTIYADGARNYNVPVEYWNQIPRNAKVVHNDKGTPEHWISYGPIPGIHMPRKLCRLVLEVTEVRVERLQAISEVDAIAEGILELVPPAKRGDGLTAGALAFAATATVEAMPKVSRRAFLGGALAAALGFKASPSRPWEVLPERWTKAPTPQQVYALLWESINGPGCWAANPWVWAVSFKRVTP